MGQKMACVGTGRGTAGDLGAAPAGDKPEGLTQGQQVGTLSGCSGPGLAPTMEVLCTQGHTSRVSVLTDPSCRGLSLQPPG